MSRLTTGTTAPALDTVDIFDEPVRLDAGRRVMLSFYRFAACPFCNLRVHRLRQLQPRLAARGLDMIAVFHSPRDVILENVARQEAPFPIVADPDMALYARYGVERSKAAMMRAALTRPHQALEAMARGFVPRDAEGRFDVIPADFLIDEQSVVRVAYYGRDIGDHLPLSRVEAFAAGASEHHATV